MEIDLALVWAGIIGFAVLTYVILDGFDLGIGILFPLANKNTDRDLMMNSVAPVWDGNETWLVMGGGGLFAAFPLAYSVILPALYMPISLMLLALVFRGVAFEYRWRTVRWKGVWDIAFAGGSGIAAMMQGITLGALVQGVEVTNRAYSGGWWDWLSPFSVLVGFAVVIGYALLGSTWLIMKTEGVIQQQMRRYAWRAAIGTLLMILLVSILTPFQDAVYFQRWFAWPTVVLSLIMPILVAVVARGLYVGLNKHRDVQPFVYSLLLFVLCFLGITISFFPYLIPPTLSIWDAAAPESSLRFALVGTVVLVPIILIYTAYAYWVFRGKVNPKESYH
ncbi:MAG: cytochrome d ubiquinol oxidase subunit II [Gammaproteobacteria bacterium]|nr:cytochrome d ubiquinol oxidase subunit II [Gammaproteobacteria bacterium]